MLINVVSQEFLLLLGNFYYLFFYRIKLLILLKRGYEIIITFIPLQVFFVGGINIMSLIKKFGAWGEKKMAGRVYEGILRTTFVIAPDGTIERVITKVDTKNAAAQILQG